MIGRRPVKATGLTGYPASDDEVRSLADKLWGKGKITEGRTGDAYLTDSVVRPDFTWSGDAKPQSIGYIHRRTAAEDIYFVNNREPVRRPADATSAPSERAWNCGTP